MHFSPFFTWFFGIIGALSSVIKIEEWLRAKIKAKKERKVNPTVTEKCKWFSIPTKEKIVGMLPIATPVFCICYTISAAFWIYGRRHCASPLDKKFEDQFKTAAERESIEDLSKLTLMEFTSGNYPQCETAYFKLSEIDQKLKEANQYRNRSWASNIPLYEAATVVTILTQQSYDHLFNTINGLVEDIESDAAGPSTNKLYGKYFIGCLMDNFDTTKKMLQETAEVDTNFNVWQDQLGKLMKTRNLPE